MSVFFDIQAALDSHLNNMPTLPPVAWENAGYEPTIGTLFIRPTILPADTVGATLGATGTDENFGVYQIDVFAEAGKAKNEAVLMADRIADHFKPVTELLYNDRLIRCVTASRAASQIIDGWYQIPIDITYLSHTIKRH